jgi:CysZ protein
MSQLARGVGDLNRGFSFLNAHPRLWGWVIAPAIATLLLLAAIVFVGWRLLQGIVTWATGFLPDWLASVAGAGLSILLGLGLAAAALLLFVSVAGAIAGPFCELLSEEVEEELTGKKGPPFTLGQFAKDATRGVAHSARRLVSSLIATVLVLLIALIPLAGTIAALLIGGWFSARAASYDCYDAVMSRRSLSYEQKLAYLERHKSRSFGLGLGVAALMLIPGVNLLALGVGAVGATLAMHEQSTTSS